MTTTGAQLAELATRGKCGGTILVTGALGNVGRSAVFTAKDNGWTVIAGVRTKHVQKAKSIGADPDAILLDLGLPKINGYEVCRELRKDSELKDALIIAQTGWGAKEDRDKPRDAGFDRHLVKPVTVQDLKQLLAEKTLQARSARQDGL